MSMTAYNPTTLLMIKNLAIEYDLDPEVICAVCQIESSWDQYSIKYEPGYRWVLTPEKFAKTLHIDEITEHELQKFSLGLMQVMGGVAREHGFTGSLLQLADVKTGLTYGCKHLAKMTKRYKKLDEVIAAYNAGSPRRETDGTFENQKHVDKFFKVFGLPRS